MRNSIRLDDLVIPNGATVSNELTDELFGLVRGFVIGAPDVLPEVVEIEVSLDDGVNWEILQSGGTDVEIAANRAVIVDYAGWDRMRLSAGGPVAADRTFRIQAVEELR